LPPHGRGFRRQGNPAALIACAAAVAAVRTARPVKLRLDRDDDMVITGKRHEFLADYEWASTRAAGILALSLTMASRCGYSLDLSAAVNDRALCHVDTPISWSTCKSSRTAARRTPCPTRRSGLRRAQGMMIIETVLDDIARARAWTRWMCAG